MLVIIFNFTNINKPNIKLNEPINITIKNINLTSENNNEILEEIEVKKEMMEKKKQIIPSNIPKSSYASKSSPKTSLVTKPKSKIKKKIIKNERKISFNEKKETLLPKNKERKIISTKKKPSSTNQNLFEDYKEELKYIIQKKATQNYPRTSLRKKEHGTVELTFSIDLQGNIKNIKIGNKTNAPKRLIISSEKTLLSISPYKKNDILKKKNTFSIIIVYKLD